jgi:hypothetical protein
MQEFRFIHPSQDAGIIVLSMGDRILTHLPFMSPDQTIPISDVSSQDRAKVWDM